jgi:ribose-phosphate pyrophosphokinase
MADACRRASAAQVVALIPYFGYSRQDRRPRAARVPITAKLVADLIAAAGINRVITVDIHADQIQGFFDVPMDNVYASPVLLGDVWKQEYPAMVVVSPDVGGVVRARALAKRLDDAELAIIDKRRPRPNQAEIMNIIGEVEGKTCVMIDDIVDTAGTLCEAAVALKKRGASRVVAFRTSRRPALPTSAFTRKPPSTSIARSRSSASTAASAVSSSIPRRRSPGSTTCSTSSISCSSCPSIRASAANALSKPCCRRSRRSGNG